MNSYIHFSPRGKEFSGGNNYLMKAAERSVVQKQVSSLGLWWEVDTEAEAREADT